MNSAPNDGLTSSATAPRWLFPSMRGFTWSSVPNDAIAGLLLAAIAIPEQLATARLAGMPTETGLYAFAAGALAFAAFGVNRFLSAGADSTIAPIFAGGLAALAATGTRDYSSWRMDWLYWLVWCSS
jgi:SulP family sulfate permease